MIKSHCFTKDWILRQRQQYTRVDPTLLEKTILAFELLGRLVKNRLDFVFKGGTCLLLLLERMRRISIDIDIMCEERPDKMVAVFDAAVSTAPFSHWEEDSRTTSDIPKKHFKFYFHSVVNDREDYVLLDVLQCKNIFPATQALFVQLDFIEVDAPIQVTVPTSDSLLGDKLTAFAPKTIGVLLDEKRSMQIIKQLFDLGELFCSARDLQTISKSYDEFLRMENRYRRTNFSRKETLLDTIEACFLISQLDLKKSIENEATKIYRRGIRQIQSHLTETVFGIEGARLAAARTALLAQMLLSENTYNMNDYSYDPDKIEHLRKLSITGEYQVLDRLKAILPEAFCYWCFVSQLRKD